MGAALWIIGTWAMVSVLAALVLGRLFWQFDDDADRSMAGRAW